MSELPLDTLIAALLVAQGVMGGIDTLLNHELIARLPHRPEARSEIGLHAIREAIYTALFGGLAWFAWHGAAAFVIVALLLGEVIVTACDELVENRARVLPQNERVLHLFIMLNLGVIIAVLTLILLGWSSRSTALAPAHHGWLSWALTALALFAAAWSVRDFVAWRKLSP